MRWTQRWAHGSEHRGLFPDEPGHGRPGAPLAARGFPNVLVEAQQSGLPVLVSDRVTRECDLTGLLTYLPLEKSAWVKALSALEVNDRPAASAEACARIDEKGFGLKAAAERLRQRYISFKK